MGRRTSGQSVGLEKIGNVQANQSTLTTTQTNADLILDPNGTGGVILNGDVTIQDRGDLRLSESASNGANYIAMQAAASMTSNYTITWPDAVAGANGYVLSSDNSGNLSWTSPSNLSISVSDPGSVATVHYPIFGTNGGSLPTSLSPQARTNLSFVPSTGELYSPIGRHPDVIGSTANSGTLTIRGTSSSTKAAASVLMSDGVVSTSSTTGTLVVTGGVGISGALNTGGKIQALFAGGADLTNSSSMLELQDNGGTSRPSIAFHRPGAFATKITLNTDNAFYFGGWSAGAGASPIVCGGANPGANNSYDLGTSSLRWRTIYTTDLELSNGIGDYTVVEGEEDLFIYNNKNGKTYKFLLQEVDKSVVPPKKAATPGA